MTTLVHPSLIVQVFAPIGGAPDDAAASRRYLERLWDAAGTLGMADPLIDGLPVELPELPSTDEPAFRLLAGRSHVDEHGIAQAYLFARHDVVGLCAALASTADDESLDRWSELVARWDGAVDDSHPPASILGETRVFTAHVAHPAAAIADLQGELDDALREMGYGAWGPPFRARDHAFLWWWRGAEGRRIVTALSPVEQETALSQRVWWRDEHEAAELVLYLLNAAKLDYEIRVHRERRSGIVASLAAIDATLGDLLRLDARAGARRSWSALEAAQERLISAQAASSSVAIELTHLRGLHRTVGIARRNLAQLAPRPGPEIDPPAESMFRRDQEVAAWLQDQIDQDVGYAEAVLARAREAHEVTSLRLQQQTTYVTRAQARVTLLQTSLTAALLSGIGAIAVLQVRFEVWEPARVPLLFAFMLMLLALPVLAAHWFDRFRTVDHVAAAVFGAAVGWVLAVVLTGRSDLLVVAAGMVVGAGVARGLTWLHDRGPRGGSDRTAT